MEKLSKEEIEILYEKIRNEYIAQSKFKNYSYENIIYKSINFLDLLFVEFLLHLNICYKEEFMLNNYRASCREFIRLFADNLQSDNLPTFEDEDINDVGNEFKILNNYNYFRNKLEKGYIGICDISYDEENNLIVADNDMNDKELIVRKLDAIKPAYNDKSFKKNNSQNKINSLLVGQFSDLPYININNFMPNIQKIKKLYDFLLQEYEDDCSIENKYSFPDFSMQDYKKVYTAIMVLAYNQIDKLLSNEIEEIVLWNKTDLIKFICDITEVDFNITNFVLNEFLIYDKKFYKELLTIYQPIFNVCDQILISSCFTLFGFAQDKLLYVINKKVENKELNLEYKKIISSIANDKEKIMIKDCLNILSSNNYKIKNNIKYSKDGSKNVDAEFDIVLFDEKSLNLLLIELKDLKKGDNEIEQHRIEENLESFCEDRVNKEIIIKDDLVRFLKINFNYNLKNDIKVNIESLVVSKNYIGISDEHKLAILDEFFLNKLFKESNYNLGVIVDKITNKKIFKWTNTNDFFCQEVSIPFLKYTLKTKVIAMNNYKK